MSGIPALDSPASIGSSGVLRSWLQGWLNDWRSCADPPRKAGPAAAHCYGSVQLLVADDNPVNLMVISALMEARGLVPWLAADGAQAVVLACDRHLDLILMDLQMPVLDGLGATAAIRRFEAQNSRPAVPVVAYTSLSPGAVVLAKQGMNGSLGKPCEDQELEDCLVRWCPTYRPAVVVHGSAGVVMAPSRNDASV